MANQIGKIPLDQIDDPQISMRSEANDDGIEELASSIKQIGLLQPVTLRAKVHRPDCPISKGDTATGCGGCVGYNRYEIITGHRRVLAARRAGLVTIEAIVREVKDREAIVFKLHENLLRREVNPVDEAIFLAKVLKEQNLDPKEIASMTRRSEAYISSRLEILKYPDYLIEAVGEKQISLGAAHWLNQISDDRVKQNYTDYAIKGGISVKRAIAWFESWKTGHLFANPQKIESPEESRGVGFEAHKETCIVCQGHEIPADMMLYYAHLECAKKIQQ